MAPAPKDRLLKLALVTFGGKRCAAHTLPT